MYEKHFGLKRLPYAMTPDPGMLYLTASHGEALAGLTYAVLSMKGFVVLAGQAGTGKTTLLRKLLKVIPETRAHVSVIFNPTLTAAEFLELLLMNFGIGEIPESKAQRLQMLAKLLLRAHEQKRIPVLIIDEAHKLSPDVLEEIRLLTNFETDEHKLLQIVLAGHPELNEVLNRADLWQLKQRIGVRVQTAALALPEVKEYLNYRWLKAESSQPLPFTQEAVALIALWSRGIPRLINAICDNSLVLAMAGGVHVVEASHILEVVRDLDIRTAAPAEERLQAVVAPPLPAAAGNGSPRGVAEGPSGARMFERYMPEPQKLDWFARWTAKLRA